MATQPRWLSLAADILSSLDNGVRSTSNDDKTRRITERCIRTLLANQALSDGLAATFVENIKRQLGREDFAWTGEIKLTRDQRIKGVKRFPQYAPVKATVASASAFVTRKEYDELATRVAFLEEALLKATEKLPKSDGEATEKLPGGPISTLYTAANCDLVEPKSYVTERNGTENHESMTSPVGSFIQHETAKPSTGHEERNHEREKSARKPALTIYPKERDGKPSVSGNLEYNGQRYRVLFGTFDYTMQRLEACAGNNEWRSTINNTAGQRITTSERTAVGAAKCTSAALYADNDSRAFKAPVKADAIVLLVWEGAEITSAVIIDGYDSTNVTLNKRSHTTHGTYYKGEIAA